jgi:hypothetical protein
MESPLDFAGLEDVSVVAIESYGLSGEERGRDDVEEVRDFVKACLRESILDEVGSENHICSDEVDREDNRSVCCIMVGNKFDGERDQPCSIVEKGSIH